MLAGATSGVTIMRMEAGLDTGPMFWSEVSLAPDETGGSLHDACVGAWARIDEGAAGYPRRRPGGRAAG